MERTRKILPTPSVRRIVPALVTLLLAGSLAHLPTSHAASSWPVALRGEAPGEVTSVRLILFPPVAAKAAQQLPTRGVPAVVSVDGARWSAAVDPGAVPAGYIRAGGLVDFDVHLHGSRTWLTAATARLVRRPDGGRAWADPSISSAAVLSEGRPGAPALLRAHGASVSYQGAHAGPAAQVDPRAVPGAGCSTQPTSQTTKRWATIGTTYPIGGSVAKMVADQSEGATFGMAVLGPGSDTWVASGSKYVSNGWSFDWRRSGKARSYWIEIQYRKWISACYPYQPSYSWRPDHSTGGTASYVGLDRPDWNDCANVAPGRWVRHRGDGSDYSYGAAVKFASMIGVDLSVRRSYSRSQKIIYDIVGAKRLCGNDGPPALAGKLMERRA